MADLNDAIKDFKSLADRLNRIGTAVQSVHESPDAPEKIAQALGKDLDRTFTPPTPLADSREDATLEQEEQVLTRVKKLENIISDMLEM